VPGPADDPLPRIPAEAVEEARSDKRIAGLLGEDAVHDYTLLVERDWQACITAVTDWERDRRGGASVAAPPQGARL
jgi:glutamine synthetase